MLPPVHFAPTTIVPVTPGHVWVTAFHLGTVNCCDTPLTVSVETRLGLKLAL